MNKKPLRRSIVSNFSEISAVRSEGPQAPDDALPSPVRNSAQPVARVGAGIIGATQRTLTDIREERDRLQDLVDAGGMLELDPKLIEPSPYPDRLPDDSDLDFLTLKQLISSEGQRIPIEVRRHPTSPGRYQVVYGHRRWRAAGDLGILVKARVVSLSDRELAIAQGIENSARQDLTWIEKALFAWRMEEAGIKARDIRAALAIDDPELARFRAVCRTLTVAVIEAIGRAPKVGRPRWIELSNAFKEEPTSIRRVLQTLAAAKVSSSDQRFRDTLATVKTSAAPSRSGVVLETAEGLVLGKVVFSNNDIKLMVDKTKAEAFSRFFMKELPAILDRFFAQEGEP